MTDKDIPDVDQILAVSDPSEVDRDKQGPIDRLVLNIGNLVAWAFPILMIAIISQVILRGAGHNQAWLDDLQWWIYGFAMLTAFGYAITTSSHVRVDIFHQHYLPARKARIEVIGLGWLLIPFIAIMTDVMIHYAVASIISGEGSSSPNGLHRLYILKTTMPILFLLCGLAAWSIFRRNLGVFTDTGLASQLIWAFPSAVFILWRLLTYAAYWFIYLTNAEIEPRRISREPVFEYLLHASLALVVLLILIGLLRRKKAA